MFVHCMNMKYTNIQLRIYWHGGSVVRPLCLSVAKLMIILRVFARTK